MLETNRIKFLRVALLAVGVIFIVGIYSLIMIWPSGWSWHSGPSHSLQHYLQMILGVDATLGIFLLIASRNPLANLSLVWFTVWSSIVHAAIMAAQSLANPARMGHLWGDVPAFLIVAAVLALLTPRSAAEKPVSEVHSKMIDTVTAARSRIALGRTVKAGLRFSSWVDDVQMKQIEMINFTKNMSLGGALLMFLLLPHPWPMSLGIG